jgi:hypothetical protein
MSTGEIVQHFPIAKSTLSGRFNLLKDARCSSASVAEP